MSLIRLAFSKDVRLPIQLQRSMAAEAEATREAKAKVGNTTVPRHMCSSAIIRARDQYPLKLECHN